MLRLYSLGFVDNVFLGMRPWTRASVSHMIEQAGARIEDADAGPATDEAQGIYDALMHELRNDTQGPCLAHQGNSRIESVYTVARGISGTPLRDSYHLGSTIINDYGRPYENGFNNYSGASGYASAGRFVLYARGEFEAAPSAAGYSQALAQALSTVDGTTFLNAATGTSLSTRPPFPWARSRHHRRTGHRGLSSPPTFSTTRSPWASRTSGSGLGWAAAWPTPTMPRTSTPSASTASSRCTFRCSPGSPDPFATIF